MVSALHYLLLKIHFSKWWVWNSSTLDSLNLDNFIARVFRCREAETPAEVGGFLGFCKPHRFTVHLNIGNVKYKPISRLQEATACLVRIAAMLLAASCTSSREQNAPGEAKVLLELDPHSRSRRREQPGPALPRGVDRARSSARMPAVASPLEEIICCGPNSVCRNIKRLPRGWHPPSPGSQGGKGHPELVGGCREDLRRNKKFIFLPTSPLMQLWL